MSFANPNDEDEKWLKQPKIDSPVGNWRGTERKRSKAKAPRPLRVGNVKKTCQHCGERCAVELFRDGKCLACQAADFLGPL
jgi:hypothetical protein